MLSLQSTKTRSVKDRTITSTEAAVGILDGASKVTASLHEATPAGVRATIGAADRRPVGAVPRTVAGQTVRKTELVDNTPLTGRA